MKAPASDTVETVTSEDIQGWAWQAGWNDAATLQRLDAAAIARAYNQERTSLRLRKAADGPLSRVREQVRSARSHGPAFIKEIQALIDEMSKWTDAEKQRGGFQDMEDGFEQLRAGWDRISPYLQSPRQPGRQPRPWTRLVNRLVDHIDACTHPTTEPATPESPMVMFLTTAVVGMFGASLSGQDREDGIAKMVQRHRQTQKTKSK